MRSLVIIIIALLLIAGGVYLFTQTDTISFGPGAEENVGAAAGADGDEQATTTNETTSDERGPESVIGQSVEGRDITAYHFGAGDEELLFVGGIHGGYEWNTVLLAYELVDYLEENPDAVPENLTVTVVPVLNPDGLHETTGEVGRFARSDVPSAQEETIPGRFNANNVDLNRNFDCSWEETGTWRSRDVSGGDAPFSEPESAAIRDYVADSNIVGAVVYYSAAGGVFAAECDESGVMTETSELTNTYAAASGYRAYEEFDFYAITGDMVNWLARENIPAISVLLTDHESVEWSRNKDGVEAVLEYYAR